MAAARIDIIIVGGGHVGMTLLADLVMTQHLHGFQPMLTFVGHRGVPAEQRVRSGVGRLLMHQVPDGLDAVVTIEPCHLTSFGSSAASMAAAEAHTIVIAVPDIPTIRMRILEWITAEVDLCGKTLVFAHAGQAGQIVIADWAKRVPLPADCSLVLVADAFYGTRVKGRAIDFKRKLSVNVSVYTHGDRLSVIDHLKRMFPLGAQIERGSWPDFAVRDGVDLQFGLLGYILHPSVALYEPNLRKTSAGIRYCHYIDGIDRPLAEQLDRLDRERVELGRAYGVTPEPFSAIIERYYGLPRKRDFYEMMQSCRGIYRSTSCGSIADLLASRHILEDVPGLHTITWLGRCAGIDLPATTAQARTTLQTLARLGADQQPFKAYQPILDRICPDVETIRAMLSSPFESGERNTVPAAQIRATGGQ